MRTTGSVQKKKRKSGWKYFPVTAHGGKRKWHKPSDTKGEAQAALVDILKELNDGTYREIQKGTLNAVSLEWLEHYEIHHKPSSHERHRGCIENHLMPEFGTIQLNEISLGHMQKYVNRRIKKDEAAANTVLKEINCLTALFEYAMKHGYVRGSNLAKSIDRPRVSRNLIKEKMYIFQPEQIQHILDSKLLLLEVLIMTGMRVGELLGLRWMNISMDDDQININRSYCRIAKALVDPKSDAGTRSVDITPDLTLRFKTHKLASLYSNDGDFVFCRPDGSNYTPSMITNAFEGAISGLKGVKSRPHDLRHTNISYRAADGQTWPYIAEQVGHSDPAFTMRVYTHTLPKADTETATSLADRLKGSVSNQSVRHPLDKRVSKGSK